MNKSDFYEIVKPYTMTSEERVYCLFDSLDYIRKNNIDGDFVECGVWKGGNILGILEYLNFYSMSDRKVWAYDTFQGMTEPETVDVDLDGNSAKSILRSVMCHSPLDEFMNNIKSKCNNISNLKVICGDINYTLDASENIPYKISLLRLDTDWYRSTKKELNVLYPILEPNGVLIVDDYGHWRGSQKAVDEFFEGTNVHIDKIDYTGIKIIKL